MNSNQPPSLRIFFATEMWERYGFYVVQTLLALYLALHFQWPDHQIYALVGSFTALTYLSPLVGGWLADHLLGQKKAILWGTMALFFSYLALSQVTSHHALCLALGGITVGTGLLKPNICSLLGNEYPEASPQRENGFTLFYIGLTLGIILGTTLPSILSNHFGWSAAFISAAISMVLAGSIFSWGIYRYHLHDYHDISRQPQHTLLALFLMLCLWFIATYILHQPKMADTLFALVVLFSLLYLLYLAKKESPAQARRTIVVGLLCVISIFFWSFYFQMFMSLTLFILRAVNPTVLGFNFPPPYYVGLQSIGMIVLGCMLARSKQPNNLTEQIIRASNKFLIAMCCMTIAYGLITIICHFNLPLGLLSPLYLMPAYLVISLAELLLSPVGLSAVTMLSSRKNVSTMMGLFFVSLGIGGYVSGKLAAITEISPTQLNTIDIKAHYATTFGYLLYLLIAASLLSFLINRLINSLLKKAALLDATN